MIKEYSLALLEKTIQYALQLDPAIDSKMAPLEGKRLAIIIKPLRFCFYLSFEDHTLRLHATPPGPIDTSIESSPLGLIRLSLLPMAKARSLFNDRIHISGDVTLGQAVKQLLDDLEIDWEGHLARFTGDVIAHQMGQMARQGKAKLTHIRRSMKHQITEYLQEEALLLPTAEALEDFYQAVDALALEVERCEAQILAQRGAL